MKKQAIIKINRDELRDVIGLKEGIEIINTSCNERGEVVMLLEGNSLPNTCFVSNCAYSIISLGSIKNKCNKLNS